jgi:hypothetical protein
VCKKLNKLPYASPNGICFWDWALIPHLFLVTRHCSLIPAFNLNQHPAHVRRGGSECLFWLVLFLAPGLIPVLIIERIVYNRFNGLPVNESRYKFNFKQPVILLMA